jgi:CRP/FNR family transcriptional regulator, nitrogen fixation regulation protein
LCGVRELEQAVSLADSWGEPGALENLATQVRCKTGETVYHCTEARHYWYRIVVGAARKSALTADGCRHIVEFLLPGDFFGFGDTHHFSVETIAAGTIVARYPRRAAEQLSESDPVVSRHIREVAFASINRLQARMVILGRTSALEKVAAFLLEMADRSRTAQLNSVILPMSRYDIADYLAIAVETVSRALTELRGRGVIAFGGVRRVRICDRQALENIVRWPADSSWVGPSMSIRMGFPREGALRE